MTIDVVTPPEEPAVDVATAKAYLRVSGTDEDALITTLIEAATHEVETYTGRALVTRTLAVTLTRHDGGSFYLPLVPVASVASVQRDGEDVDFTLLGDTLVFPSGHDVTITYDAGYGAAGDVPALARLGVLRILATLYDKREDVLSEVTVTELGRDTFDRLNPLRRVLVP